LIALPQPKKAGSSDAPEPLSSNNVAATMALNSVRISVDIAIVVILQQNLPLLKRFAVAVAPPGPSVDNLGALLAFAIGVDARIERPNLVYLPQSCIARAMGELAPRRVIAMTRDCRLTSTIATGSEHTDQCVEHDPVARGFRATERGGVRVVFALVLDNG
jgi:hypothetical protein